MGCHGTGKISYSPNEIFLEDFFSHLVGSIEQFGTHEKLSWGRGVQGRLNYPPTYKDKINNVPSYDHT